MRLQCTGTPSSDATYGGRLDLLDVDTGEVTYLGDLFGPDDVSEYTVARFDRVRRDCSPG